MKSIPLTRGYSAIVDDDDFEWLSSFKWCVAIDRRRLHGTYAQRKLNYKIVRMHNFIMNPPAGMVVDHIDGNGLNNCRSNLRICTPKENCRNSRHGRGFSKYKGVQRRLRRGKRDGIQRWIAVIRVDRKLIPLGTFKNEHDATRAYNSAAVKHFGEFALLNKIDKQP